MRKETENKKSIGLFGGTFNPVHIGHLRGAEEIAELFNMSKVFFIPSCIPPHKNPEAIAPAMHRFEMINLAIQTNPLFSVSDIEIKREGSSYSVDTIRYFKNFYDQTTEIYFITGTDAFGEINTWKGYPELFSLCNFIVMSRPGCMQLEPKALINDEIEGRFIVNGKKGKVFIHNSGKRIFFISITLIDVSSSRIRNKFHKGLSSKYLVSEKVEKYIINNRLYFNR